MPPSNGDAPTRTALITGATGGLGTATVAHFTEIGFRVIAAGRNRSSLTELADRFGPSVDTVVVDIADPDSVLDVAGQVGAVDVLVNNAGVLLTSDTDPSTVDLKQVGEEFAVNTLGSWRMAQAVIPGMCHRGWGRVVNVSSGTASMHWGLRGGVPGYAVSKVALNAVTKLLASETRGTGVLVNALNPGRIKTPMMSEADRAPEDAAADIGWAATLPENGPTGKFFRRSGEEMDW